MNIKIVVCLLLALLASPAWSQTEAPPADPAADNPALSTRLALRDLWVEHVFWVRNYVIANQAGNQEAAEAAAHEVVSNATSIASSIAALYGQPAADQLLQLLAEHWGAVKHYSDASMREDAAAREAARIEISTNAQALAAFLSSANPYLPEPTLMGMLTAHGGHHMTQIDQFASGDITGEAQTWHRMREHMLALADALSAALVKQFPESF